MFEVLADAKTSAGAPSRICSRNAELEPRLSRTSTPGLALSNAASTSAKASVKEAAADTSSSPSRPDAAVICRSRGGRRGVRHHRHRPRPGAPPTRVLVSQTSSIHFVTSSSRCENSETLPIDVPPLSPTEHAVLGVLAEAPTHGFAIAKDLAPGTSVGRVLTVRRPLVYRALDRLVAARSCRSQCIPSRATPAPSGWFIG